MNTIKFLNNQLLNNVTLDMNDKISSIRRKLYSLGICWTDSVSGKFDKNDSFRVILYLKAYTNNIDYSNAMVAECNGLIVEYQYDRAAEAQQKEELSAPFDRFIPIVVPMPNFNKNKISVHQLDKYYVEGHYSLYEVLDATIINLYYFDNGWRISSIKGYDIGNFPFANDKTYSEVFMQIVKENYKNFNLDSLPKTNSYTIAMRYEKFHLFDENKHIYSKSAMKSYMYVLQTYNLQTMKSTNDVYCGGIPYQSPVVIRSAKNVMVLNDYAKHAYSKYMKAYSTNQYKYKPLYGYILRANNGTVSNQYKNILITSSLFKIIKFALYKNRPSTINGIIAQMFVHRQHKEKNIVLFQQFDTQFTKLEALAKHVCEDTLAILSGHDHISSNEVIKKFSIKLGEDMIRDELITEGTLHLSAIYDYLHSQSYVKHIEELIVA